MYRHYKGGLYRVESACTIEASGEAGVLYRSVDPREAAMLWMRPASDFQAELPDGQVRFTRVRDTSAAALRDALNPSLVSPTALEDILSRYDEPWRFYHTREHLYQMFDVARAHRLMLSPEQKLAILFHDLVYVPGAKPGMNESQSAVLARSYRDRVNDKVNWDLVCQMVEETSHSKLVDGPGALVCSLDLAGLASKPQEFASCTELIWLENRHLLSGPDARKTYDTERLKFLLNLAAAERLFCPELAELEDGARLNIEALRQAWLTKYAVA